MPRHDVAMRHDVVVRAVPQRTYEALWRTDFSRSRTVRTLLRLRGMRLGGGSAAPRAITLESFERAGFQRLAERPGGEVVLGLVGRFWTPAGRLRKLASDEFAGFDEPGYAKAAWGFAVEELPPGVTRLVTETRVLCTDTAARRRFRAYWMVVGPFSGVIRRAMLAAVRREAERTEQPRTTGSGET